MTVLVFAALLTLQTAGAPRRIETLAQFNDSLEALVKKSAPAVVKVLASGYTPLLRRSREEDGESGNVVSRLRSSGSGVIVSKDGYILTNQHVVEGARNVKVLLTLAAPDDSQPHSIVRPPGRTVAARIVGTDRETDLAVLKINERDLPVLEFADSEKVRPGQLSLAIGSPLGLDDSVSFGVISTAARQLKPDDATIYIQTDAPINPGNSGGPLLDMSGRLIGITTLILSQSGGSEGLGFAIPSNIVRRVFEQIRANGGVARGQIGVAVQTITPSLAQGLKLPRGYGVVVSDVTPRGPAEVSGIEVGDVVLALNGKRMENARQFVVNIYLAEIGKAVKLYLLRGKERIEKEVSVLEQPNDLPRLLELIESRSVYIPKLHVLALPLEGQVLKAFESPRKLSGVLVAGQTSQATPLQRGDIIYALNGTPMRMVAELAEAVQRLAADDVAVLQVERGGKLHFVTVEVE